MDELHVFAARGDAASLVRLLSEQASSISASVSGASASSPLFDVNADAASGLTPLHLAALGGHTDAIRVLLDAGAVSSPTRKGLLPIHFCAMRGHTAALEQLVLTGACSIDAPIVVAAAADDVAFPSFRPANVAVRRELRMWGARQRLRAAVASDPGRSHECAHVSPLALACEHGHADTAAACLRLDAKRAWAAHGAKYTLLHVAARFGHADVCSVLLDAGVDIHGAPAMGVYTPLATACVHAHVDVVKLLLARGSRSDITRLRKHRARPVHDARCRSCLAVAITHGHVDVCRALLEAGAAPRDIILHADSSPRRMTAPDRPDGVHAVLTWLYERATDAVAAQLFHDVARSLAHACVVRHKVAGLNAALMHVYTDTPYEMASLANGAHCYDATSAAFLSPCTRATATDLLPYVARSDEAVDILCTLLRVGARVERRMALPMLEKDWARLLPDPVRVAVPLLLSFVSSGTRALLSRVVATLNGWAWRRRVQAVRARVTHLQAVLRARKRAAQRRKNAEIKAALAAAQSASADATTVA